MGRKKKETTAIALGRENVLPDSERVDAFAERLVNSGGSVDLRECFAHATDLVAYMTAVRNKTMVQASRYVPAAVTNIGRKAAEGDLDAAKLLFDYLGLRVKQPLAQVATQVQINVPTLRDIIDVTEEN